MPKIIIECRKNNIIEVLNYLSKLGYNHIYDEYGNNPSNQKIVEFIDGENIKDLF